jgi:hypothetical protein
MNKFLSIVLLALATFANATQVKEEIKPLVGYGKITVLPASAPASAPKK